MIRRTVVLIWIGAAVFGHPSWTFGQANVIEGKVLFVGDPAQYPTTFAAESETAKCGERSVRLTKEDVVINHTSPPTLSNVIVSIRAGIGRVVFFKVTDEVRLNLRDCQFAPHVLTLNTGQPLRVVNGDDTPHKIRLLASLNDAREFELAANDAIGGEVLNLKAESTIQLTCAGIPGRSAFVGVFEHPFHTVTRSDGKFALVGMPDGTYSVEAWHEVFGSQLAVVKVEKNIKGLHDFVFPAPEKPASKADEPAAGAKSSEAGK